MVCIVLNDVILIWDVFDLGFYCYSCVSFEIVFVFEEGNCYCCILVFCCFILNCLLLYLNVWEELGY